MSLPSSEWLRLLARAGFPGSPPWALTWDGKEKASPRPAKPALLSLWAGPAVAWRLEEQVWLLLYSQEAASLAPSAGGQVSERPEQFCARGQRRPLCTMAALGREGTHSGQHHSLPL